jgi:hypothetical protein
VVDRGRVWIVEFDSDAVLFELRPKRGAIAVRAIYARVGDRFVVVIARATERREG